MTNTPDNSFFIFSDIKKRKDAIFKQRIEDTIIRCALSKRQFYEKVGVTPAYWYRLSWKIDKIPSWLKSKLCSEFGKPFVDFFLILEEEK